MTWYYETVHCTMYFLQNKIAWHGVPLKLIGKYNYTNADFARWAYTLLLPLGCVHKKKASTLLP